MKLLSQEGKCPHCHSVIHIRKLRKIPFSGSLKWYEFTPSPKQACPECSHFIKHTMAGSKWLYLPFIMISIVIGGIFFEARLSFLEQFAIIIISAIGVHLAMQSGEFLSDEPGKN